MNKILKTRGISIAYALLCGAGLLALLLVSARSLLSPVWIVLICAGFGAAAYRLVLSFKGRAVLAALLVLVWLLALIGKWKVPRLFVVLEMPLILTALIETIHGLKGEEQAMKLPVFTACCLFSLILLVLPSSSKPYPYKLLNKALKGVEVVWQKVETRLFYRSKKRTEFSINATEEASKDQILSVWLDFGGEYIAYLPGTSLDHFDGSAWSHGIEEASAGDLLDWNYDTAEHIYALWRQDHDAGEISDDVFRKRRVDLAYQKLNTASMFTLPGLLRIKADEERYPFEAEAGRVWFDYQQKKDCDYTLYFLQENPDEVKALIQASEGYTYDPDKKQSWGQISGDYAEQFLLHISQTMQIEEVLSERRKLIQKYYLQLPEELSPEAEKVADQVTAGLPSGYEKLRAIEAYLQENGKYAETPAESLPAFLRELEGSSTDFATAACLLCRASGVPARYVEGYRTTIQGQTTQKLKSGSRHAWCEGYIDGYGWVLLEASPGFAAIGSAWDAPEKTEEKADASSLPVVNPAEAIPAKKGGAPTGWIVLGAFLLMAGAWLVYHIRRMLWERKLSSADKVQAYMMRLFRLLAKRGYVRYSHETLRVFFQKVYWKNLKIGQEEADRALKILEDAIFGEAEISEQDQQHLENLIRRLRKIPAA